MDSFLQTPQNLLHIPVAGLRDLPVRIHGTFLRSENQ